MIIRNFRNIRAAAIRRGDFIGDQYGRGYKLVSSVARRGAFVHVRYVRGILPRTYLASQTVRKGLPG